MDTRSSGARFTVDNDEQEQEKKGPRTKLEQFSSEELLNELAKRGGTLRACAEAQLLCIRKADDYRNGAGHKSDAGLDVYFPFGLVSYVQMLHTKTQRLISLTRKEGSTNFESVTDTALDLINYASFLADWLDRKDQGKA